MVVVYLTGRVIFLKLRKEQSSIRTLLAIELPVAMTMVLLYILCHYALTRKAKRKN